MGTSGIEQTRNQCLRGLLVTLSIESIGNVFNSIGAFVDNLGTYIVPKNRSSMHTFQKSKKGNYNGLILQC